MIKENDLRLLRKLRNNSRENLTTISKEIKVPISTIYDKLRKYRNDIIEKNTVLLNFRKLGYDIRVKFLLKVDSEDRNSFEYFMRTCGNINTLSRVNNGYDFMAEALFRNMVEFKEFTERLADFQVNTVKEYFILEDLKREGFLTDDLNVSAG